MIRLFDGSPTEYVIAPAAFTKDTKVTGSSLGLELQIPLLPAAVMTVARCQGLTLSDGVELRNSGMTYAGLTAKEESATQAPKNYPSPSYPW